MDTEISGEVLADNFTQVECSFNQEYDGLILQLMKFNETTLISSSYSNVLQWEITENNIQLERCITQVEDYLSQIRNVLSVEDGVHLLVLRSKYLNDVRSEYKISVYNLKDGTLVCERTLHGNVMKVILLSETHVLALQERPESLMSVYSIRKTGTCDNMNINIRNINYHCVDVYKLQNVKNTILVLYRQYLELWTVTEDSCSILDHYEFQTVEYAVAMIVIDSTKVIVLNALHWDQYDHEETLLSFGKLKVVSETLIPWGKDRYLLSPHV